jgi:hypothetical protein
MRKTTTYLSNRSAAASFALGLVAAFGVTAVPAAAQGPVPERVTVERGNTLWGLAEAYLGDPLLWPAIYRLNTDVVEDPHWIYPGEVLRLVGTGDEPTLAGLAVTDTLAADSAMLAADSAMVAAVQAPPPPVTSQATVFSRRRESLERARHELRVLANPPYRPLRRGEFYSAGFLTDGDDLPLGRVIGSVEPLAIGVRTERTTAMIYQQIAVEPPRGAAYQLGDELWIVRIAREIADHGNVVVPAGIARVVAMDGDRPIAQLSETFDRVRQELAVLPLEPFPDAGAVRPVPVEDGIMGRVIASRGGDPLTGPQSIVFLDRGRADGLSLGDMFAFVRPSAGAGDDVDSAEQYMGAAMVVYLRDRTASLLVVAVGQPDIGPGTPARLIRKMPQ